MYRPRARGYAEDMARDDYDDGYDNAADLDREGIPTLEEPVNVDEGMIPPGDSPRGADEFGTTAAEQRRGESLAQRDAQTEPDVGPGGAGERATERMIADGDEGPGDVDDEKDVVAEEAAQPGTAPSAEEAAVRADR